MSDKPTSFHDFKWACGHIGPGFCKICRNEQSERRRASLEQVNAENGRLREAIENTLHCLHAQRTPSQKTLEDAINPLHAGSNETGEDLGNRLQEAHFRIEQLEAALGSVRDEIADYWRGN